MEKKLETTDLGFRGLVLEGFGRGRRRFGSFCYMTGFRFWGMNLFSERPPPL